MVILTSAVILVLNSVYTSVPFLHRQYYIHILILDAIFTVPEDNSM